MNKTSNKKLTAISKVLRKNMTKEENHLWHDFLKKLSKTVNRQKVIGPYVVDFYCAEARLVIELDGSQHHTKEGSQEDFLRDAFLQSLGITVVRYSNLDIREKFEEVCSDILRRIYPNNTIF